MIDFDKHFPNIINTVNQLDKIIDAKKYIALCEESPIGAMDEFYKE